MERSNKKSCNTRAKKSFKSPLRLGKSTLNKYLKDYKPVKKDKTNRDN